MKRQPIISSDLAQAMTDSRVCRQFKLNRPFGFIMDHRNAFANAIIFDQVSTASLTSLHPRSLLSIATLNNTRSRILPVISSRARIAQTYFGSNGRFWPMIRPLFQALRFGVNAGSWTLGIICPPCPRVSTAQSSQHCRRFEWQRCEGILIHDFCGCFEPQKASGDMHLVPKLSLR